MPVKKAPKAQTRGDIGPIKAYDFLLRRQMSEDRIIGERTRMFLLANSFLFLAFAILLDPTWEGHTFTVLRISLPIAGILLSALLYSANRGATNALAFWHGAQEKIERKVFSYMRINGIAPHIQGNEAIWGRMMWKRSQRSIHLKPRGRWKKVLFHPWIRPTNHWITSTLFPLFCALWIAALVVAIIRTVN
jgi:hypothetical protein